MESQSAVPLIAELPEKRGGKTLVEEVWEESKKLWEVAGPAVFTRIVLYSMTIVSQAFAGHLGDRDLAAFSIANTVISGLNFGILVRKLLFLLLRDVAASSLHQYTDIARSEFILFCT
jgi:MATE family multidrug resistance protein